jgi:hypothetical protein
MKKKKDWVSIKPELFRAGVIEFHTNSKRMVKHIRANGGVCEDNYFDDCAGCVHSTYLNTDGFLYVYVGDGKLTTLVHECFHAAVRYLAYVGVPLETNEPNETYAYFIEYLVGEFNRVKAAK